MKRFVILFLLLFACYISAYNQQRLAILPMAENIVLDLVNQSASLASICIDEALAPPGREVYNRVLEKGIEEILINGQKYDGGLQGLVEDNIAEVITQGYSNVEIGLKKGATYRGQPVTNVSYRQLTPTNIGNKSHNAEGIITDLIFKNFDFKGKTGYQIQDEFWQLEGLLTELKKNNLLTFDASGKLSDASLQFVNRFNELTKKFPGSEFSNQDNVKFVEHLSQKFGLTSRSLEENVGEIISICNEIDKIANDFQAGKELMPNQYIKTIAKSRYDAIGLTVEINGKKQYWELNSGLAGTKNSFKEPIEIPVSASGRVERIGNRYFFNEKIIMDAIDLPDELLNYIRSEVGTGKEARFTFSKEMTSYDNVKGTLQSMQIQHQFDLSRYAFDDLLDAERFEFGRASVAELPGGFTITIPKVASASRGNLAIKIRNVLTANYNRVRIKIRSLIRQYTENRNAIDFLDELQEELEYLQYTTDIKIIAELSDRRITKLNNHIRQNEQTFIAYGNYKAEEYFYGDHLSFASR